jgi:hypothetical protein
MTFDTHFRRSRPAKMPRKRRIKRRCGGWEEELAALEKMQKSQ